MTSTVRKRTVKLQISIYVTALESTVDMALAGCWLMYIGCRAVQQMLMGLCTLNNSSLKSGCELM